MLDTFSLKQIRRLYDACLPGYNGRSSSTVGPWSFAWNMTKRRDGMQESWDQTIECCMSMLVCLGVYMQETYVSIYTHGLKHNINVKININQVILMTS